MGVGRQRYILEIDIELLEIGQRYILEIDIELIEIGEAEVHSRKQDKSKFRNSVQQSVLI